MNIVKKLTLTHLKQNKKRTIITIIGIAIAVAMITAVSTTVVSFRDLLIRRQLSSTGYWHVLYRDVPADKIDDIKNDKNTDTIMVTKDLGYSLLDNSENDYKPYLFLKAYNDDAFDGMPLTLSEGRMPETTKEIVISKHIIDDGGVDLKVGDTITLDLGERAVYEEGQRFCLSQDCSYLDDSDVEDTNGEKFELIGDTRTYTIVGIVERPAFENYFSPGYSVFTYLDVGSLTSNDTVNVSVYLDRVNKKVYTESEKTAKSVGIPKENISYNDYVLTLYGAGNDRGINSMLMVLEVILILIIVIGSISLIYNAFAISISERSRYLGMLASVGATKRQKRSSVYFEGLIIGAISIPIGIVSGILGIGITLKLINPIFKRVVIIDEDLHVVISLSAIVVAIIFSIVTIVISTYLPARRASKISPVDAIKQSVDIKITKKSIKTSKLTHKLFGIEGDIALKNLKRNKKRYRATVFSMIISLILFLTVASYGYYLKKAYMMTVQGYNYDVMIGVNNNNSGNLYSEVSELDSVDEATTVFHLRYADVYLENSNLISSELNQYIEDLNLLYEYEDESKKMNIDFIGLDDESYEKYAKKVGVDLDDKSSNELGGILLNNVILRNGKKAAEIKMLDVNAGDDIAFHALTYDDDEENDSYTERKLNTDTSFKVLACTNVLPMGMDNSSNYYCSVTCVMSKTDLMKLQNQVLSDIDYEPVANNDGTLFLSINNHSKFTDDLEQILSKYSDYYVYDANDSINKEKQMILIISIFAYGFIALITLICIANIFNTISTSINLRSREFAMIKSVGMTPRSFNKMIAFESIFYGIKALSYGLPISFVIMYGVYWTVHENFSGKFSLPVLSLAIAIFSVFIVVFSAMMYSASKVKKENVIDALKKDII